MDLMKLFSRKYPPTSVSPSTHPKTMTTTTYLKLILSV